MYLLERIAVSKHARKMGIGAQLLKELESQSKKNGADKVSLSAQEVAINFYLKYGYQKIGDEFLDYDVIHQQMEKEL